MRARAFDPISVNMSTSTLQSTIHKPVRAPGATDTETGSAASQEQRRTPIPRLLITGSFELDCCYLIDYDTGCPNEFTAIDLAGEDDTKAHFTKQKRKSTATKMWQERLPTEALVVNTTGRWLLVVSSALGLVGRHAAQSHVCRSFGACCSPRHLFSTRSTDCLLRR